MKHSYRLWKVKYMVLGSGREYLKDYVSSKTQDDAMEQAEINRQIYQIVKGATVTIILFKEEDLYEAKTRERV